MPYPPNIGLAEYTGWKDEQWAWKNTVYIGDWSFVPQIRVTGPDALRLFSDLSINTFEKFPIGKAKHCVQCDENGKVITEGVLLRHGEDDFELECGIPQWTLFHMKTGGYDATATFPFTHKLQVSGPDALALCEKLTGTNLREVKFMTTKQATIAGKDVLLLRQGMAGEIGFELHGPMDQHAEIYNAVVEAGQEYGIRRLGWRWIQINHLESWYPTASVHYLSALADGTNTAYVNFMNDNLPNEWAGTAMEGPLRYAFGATFTGSWSGPDIEGLYRSPVELGWTKSIAFDHDFIGRAALEAEVASPRRVGVTLEFNSEDLVEVYASMFSDGDVYHLFEIPHPPFASNWVDVILKDGKEIGHATHPGYSYTYRKALAVSFVDAEFATPGTEVTVLWGNPGEPQRQIRATVARKPYKQDDRRKDLVAAATTAGAAT
jgi:vanillate/3-O-methylgallate O-demethylase